MAKDKEHVLLSTLIASSHDEETAYKDDDDHVPQRRYKPGRGTIIVYILMVVTLFSYLSRPIWEPIRSTITHHCGGQKSKDHYLARAQHILKTTPLIDGHNDLAVLIRVLNNNHIYDDKFRGPFENGGMAYHVDLPRLREGQVGGAFWAAFAPCADNGTDFSDENLQDSVAFTYSQIDLLRRLQSAYPSVFSPPPTSSHAARKSFKHGQIISPLAIEGLHQIGGPSSALSNLRAYAALGVKYATLTHNCHNAYADAALLEYGGGNHSVYVAEPLHNGISSAGRSLIREMNRLGLLVDLSHTSVTTQRDALVGKPASDDGADEGWSGSRSPPIFSHSSAYALCPHPRNVPDDILQLVRQRNGLVMVNFLPDFVSCRSASPPRPDGLPDSVPENATLSHVADHIVYIGELIGYAHVGLGSDFDGGPSSLKDVSEFPELVAELLRRGVGEKDVRKVVGENLLRVWEEVDRVKEEMRREGVLPGEDEMKNLFPPQQ
jgi:membrane dipeptidase